MAETKRLGVWGWFVRAFAAGFGAMCGMIAAAVVAGAVSYALVAAGVLAFAPLGGIELNTAGTSAPVAPGPTTTIAPAYPTTVQPSRYAPAGPYVGSNPYASDSPPTTYSAAPGPSTFGQADNDAPMADVQAIPPVITIPSQPTTSPVDPARPLASPGGASP